MLLVLLGCGVGERGTKAILSTYENMLGLTGAVVTFIVFGVNR
jgi:hypothetical protein